MDRLLECALFVVGLIFGSFLNVCISRIPRDESIISPPSHCPHCGSAIHWYDNIPLISWLILRRRCRDCAEPISARYPAVELLTGILFAATYAAFGLTWLTLKFCVFTFLVLGLIFMDAETGLLPREFTYSGIALGLVFSWIAPGDVGGTAFLLRAYGKTLNGPHWASFIDAFAGALLGAGFFYLAWAAYYIVRKRHGLGFGDIALMAMSGAFLGLKLILLVIVLAPLSSILYVVYLLVREAFGAAPSHPDESIVEGPFLSREIPFGIFLGVCSLLTVFAGEVMWSWYLGMF